MGMVNICASSLGSFGQIRRGKFRGGEKLWDAASMGLRVLQALA